MTDVYVLDSYAILALLGREAGSDEVADLLSRAREEKIQVLMTWINAGEVAYIVERRWGRTRLFQVLGILEATKIKFVPIGRELALAAAHVKAGHPLAYADAFAAALTRNEGATLVTGDPEFKALDEDLSIHWLARKT